MMMLRRIFLLFLFLLSNSLIVHSQNVTADDIASLSITGWWSDCIFEQEPSACAGNYSDNDEPTPLDVTGNTCYVNPYVSPTSTTKNVVFWLGSRGTDNGDNDNQMPQSGIYLYVLRVNDGTFLPTNCTDSGACDCDSLDSLRDPWRTTGECSGGCSVTPADNLTRLAHGDDDCAVLFKESVINPFFNGTIVTCSIQGTLVKTRTASPTTMSSPTGAPTMTSATSGPTEPEPMVTSGGDGSRRNATRFGFFVSLIVFVLLYVGMMYEE